MNFEINDVWLYPSEIASEIIECNIYTADGMLPMFTSPTSKYVSEKNYKMLNESKLNTIIPKSVNLEARVKCMTQSFVDFSYQELFNLAADKDFISNIDPSKTYYICIEYTPSNGVEFFQLCRYIRIQFGRSLSLMIYNIGSPNLYCECCRVGADFVILDAEASKVYLGFRYPSGSLIVDCKNEQWKITETIKDADICDIACPYKAASIIYVYPTHMYGFMAKYFVLGADYIIINDFSIKTKTTINNSVDSISNQLVTIMQHGGIRTLHDWNKIKYNIIRNGR